MLPSKKARCGRSSRGQISLEYLFLAVISLAVISISLAALLKIRDTGERAYHLGLFRAAAGDIHDSGQELCAMGSGNSVRIHVGENITVSSENGRAVFSNEELNISFSKETACPYRDAEAAAGSDIGLANEDGELVLG